MRFPYAFIRQQAYFRIFTKLFTTSNLSPYFEKVKSSSVLIIVDHHVTQTNGGGDAVFRTMVWSSATLKEELSAPRETLINAGCAELSSA